MAINSVLELRKKELAQSTREFKARGSKVIRCEQCLLPQADCICANKPVAQGKVAFCFLMYKGEAYKPSNTGRLIADVIEDNHAFTWQRTQIEPALKSLLDDERYAPIVIFPHQYAESARCVHDIQDHPAIRLGKTPLFIMLDGTWHEAKKMFKSAYLANYPVLGIHPEQASSYLLRDAAHIHQLCTAEVAIAVLKISGELAAADILADYFSLFCQRYMVVKPHLLNKQRV